MRGTRVDIGGHRGLPVSEQDLPRLLCAIWGETIEPGVGEFHYRLPAQQIANRLDLLGVSARQASTAFDAEIQQLSDVNAPVEISDVDLVYPDPTWDQTREDFWEIAKRERRDLQDLALDTHRWCDLVRAAFQQEPERRLVFGVEPGNMIWLMTLLRGLDCLIALRLLLIALPDEQITVRIPNELFHQPISDTSNAVADALSGFRTAGATYAPTVVLTEGSTDVEILSKTLQIRHPHLTDLITFMDFHAPNKPEGSAPALVRMVKAFAAAGITNRIVALLDNDAAGVDAARSLNTQTLPYNIVVRFYPPLELAKSYPTISPDDAAAGRGPQLQDVNGLACSIEMYVGIDALKGDGEDLPPVGLKGKIGDARQGVVTGKRDIQRRFRAKADAAIRVGTSRPEDWADLDAIIRMIIETRHPSAN